MSSTVFASTTADSATALEIEMAERHRRVLCEVQAAALDVTRAFADLAIASAHAARATLAPDAWHPELERAQAIGASRHAAEAFHRVTRALRLTMAMERAVVTSMSDAMAGRVATPVAPIFTATFLAPGADIPPLTADSPQTHQEARVMASEASGAAENLSFDPRDSERLTDIERGDRFGRLKFRETVERICADIGVKPDWDRWEGDAPRPSGSCPISPDTEHMEPPPKAVDPPPDDPVRPSASHSLPPGSSPPPRCGSSVPGQASRTASG